MEVTPEGFLSIQIHVPPEVLDSDRSMLPQESANTGLIGLTSEGWPRS